MTPNSAFWEEAVSAAVEVPAAGAERASWTARNLAELALMLEVEGEPVGILDDVVRCQELTTADHRLVARLRGLRARRGKVPAWYPSGSHSPLLSSASEDDHGAARVMLQFADELHDGAGIPCGARTTSQRDAARSVSRRRAWRPTRTPFTEPKFVSIDLPAELLWRPWMTLPRSGVVRVVGRDSVHLKDADVWWGVHDGTHLDHLARYDTTRTTPVEFGAGLLVTEALAMCAELLCGAEALVEGNLGTQAVVRAGLIERVKRQPGLTAGTTPAAGACEFRALPTLARAYVAGALPLMARDFRDRLVPGDISTAFALRWERAASISSAVRELQEQAQNWWGRHGA